MKAQHSTTQIASIIGRYRTTISHDLRRNAGFSGYSPKQVCERADECAKHSRNAHTVKSCLKSQFGVLLRLQWSPEKVGSNLPVSHETRYQHVYAHKTQGGSLWKNLRCPKQKKKRYASGRDRRGQIPNRRPLSERPAHIEGRKQIGHWECDTVIGANHKQAIVTVVERKSGYAVIAKVSNKTADLVGQAIISALKPFAAKVKTLTYDNGKEFCDHPLIDEALKSLGCFAIPFANPARGSNVSLGFCQNINGLLRRYVLKKLQISDISDEEIKMIEYWLNNRPRRRLGFKTPAEVYHQSLIYFSLLA